MLQRHGIDTAAVYDGKTISFMLGGTVPPSTLF